MTEEEILHKVYKKGNTKIRIVKSETPDFIITDLPNNTTFGVEITTLYNNEVSAIMRKDKFKNKFIDNNRPDLTKKKKKSKRLKKLNVVKVEGGEGFVHKGHAIYHTVNLSDFFDFLKKMIQKKNDSYDTVGKLEFVNLIAKNEDNLIKVCKMNPGEFYESLRKHNLFETIISSNFQEIYFVSEFHTGTFNIPLKWYIFTCEYELFKKFWLEKIIISQNQKNDIDLLLKKFCGCLIHLGFMGVYFFNGKAEDKYIVFGNTYWQINLKNKTIDEKYFRGKVLDKKTEMRAIFRNHSNYAVIFDQYMNFRNSINLVPNFKDNLFIKLS